VSSLGRIPGWLDDGATLLLVVFAIPVIILAIGTPVALFVRLVVEIARRL
jgi:hypothetical protein